LASDLAVHHEVAGDCAKYFRLDAESIADSLVTMLTDRAALDLLAANCSSNAALYDWDKSAEEMLTVLLSVSN
jgi:hypothetical protein